MNTEMEEKIVKLLESSEHGLTINEIADKLKMYRATASKYLLIMEAQGVIAMRQIGPAKVYSLRDAVREMVRKMERSEVVKKKDWIDKLVSEIKTEVKGGIQ